MVSGGVHKVEQRRGSAIAPRQAATPIDKQGDRDVGLADLRFRALLRKAEWESLPVEVRARFSKRLAGGRTIVYTGVATRFHMNRAGWILAQLLRLAGGPLPLHAAIGAASLVAVTEDAATGGQVWTRVYTRRNGFPQVIHSAKRFSGPTGLEEDIGYGVSMALRVAVEDGALTFHSAGYYLKFGALRLRLPGWLSPGALAVRHRAIDAERFEFSLVLNHRLFGTMIVQAGEYREVRPACDGPENR